MKEAMNNFAKKAREDHLERQKLIQQKEKAKLFSIFASNQLLQPQFSNGKPATSERWVRHITNDLKFE